MQTVINLALNTSDHALPDERAVVETLGMKYVHIPVVWEAPTTADFEAFCTAMDVERIEGRTVFVHCVANKRVSAFLFLYRTLRLGVPKPLAQESLHKLWSPDGTWAEFIERVSAAMPAA